MSSLVQLLLPTLVLLGALFVYRHVNRQEPFLPLARMVNTTYDYVIVGAGSAGCVIASRLSETRGVTVLLLEAGPDDRKHVNTSIPGLAATLLQTELDWAYYTEPQKFAFSSFNGNRSYWARGRVLGGSSSLNYMAYVRGHRLDYDQWAEQGNEGWSYKDVLPYFIKSEDNYDEDLVRSGYHGKGGPLKVSTSKTFPLVDVWLQAGQELGLQHVDYNGETMEGVALIQATQADGLRSSTSRAFLHPVLHRDNLHVADEAHVTKVLFERKRAVGVEFVRYGRKQQVRAGREVILSAGAIGSPQLLQVSGVGPKDLLDKYKIPVVADLPVGDNLQDHLFFDYHVGLKEAVSVTTDNLNSFWTWLQYTVFKTGVWTSPAFSEAQLFVSTDGESRNTNWPDLQIFLIGRLWNTHFLQLIGYTEESLDQVKRRDVFSYGFPCMGSLLRPKSRGTLSIRSADPFMYPAIDPHYLEDPRDMAVLIRGVRMCQKLVATQALQSVQAEATDPAYPPCAKHTFDTDQYWECTIRHKVFNYFHGSGTCKMGPLGDKTTVVDPQLRVKGVQGLRVADASIMPNIPSGNTNAPCIMVGEKAADLIKATYNDL